ncbi:MAG TPA: hypothetical protein VFC63_03780 [Blastocatellia bacterium]|nr:hypothetical protein [Blastocatellia bacterium]
MRITRACEAHPGGHNLRRLFLTLLLLPLLMGVNYCEHKLPVPKPLQIRATDTPVSTLLSQINAGALENTIQARATMDFEDFSEATKGTKRTIPTANALIVLKRPQNIRLVVEAPILSIKVADMVSDGHQFKVAVLWPSSSKKFLIGSNNQQYTRIEGETKTNNADLQRAGALANIRPQHLTDAILMRPVEPDANSMYFVEQATEVEPDPDITHKKGSQVERPYYVVTLLERENDGEARITRRVWFDRTAESAPLTRQQFFENGRVATDVTYSEFFRAGAYSLPKKIFVRRPDDKYAVTITLKPESVQVNGDVPATAFVLNNDENLPEINLDARVKAGPSKP